MSDPLSDLTKQFPTDKGPAVHNYTPVYDFLFRERREKVRKVLEIGVFGGDSIRCWCVYFPNAQVWGVDVKDFGINPAERSTYLSRFEFILGDITEETTQQKIRQSVGDNIDLIVDDGSHRSEDVWEAYDALWPLVKSGGYYVVEDMAPVGNGHAMWIMRK